MPPLDGLRYGEHTRSPKIVECAIYLNLYNREELKLGDTFDMCEDIVRALDNYSKQEFVSI